MKLKITDNGQAALTDEELNYLENTLLSGDRAGFYLGYHNMTGSSQAILQTRISTFSENAGGIAYAANIILQAELGNPSIGNVAYSGIYYLSQQVANSALLAINADIADGGTGFITDPEFFQSAQQAWNDAGLETVFPAYFVNEAIQNIEELGLSFPSFDLNDMFSQLENFVTQNPGISFLDFSEAIDKAFIDSTDTPGFSASIKSVLINFLTNNGFGKRLSDYQNTDDTAIEGFEIYDLPDNENKIVYDTRLNKIVSISRNSFITTNTIDILEAALDSINYVLSPFIRLFIADWADFNRRGLTEGAGLVLNDGDINPHTPGFVPLEQNTLTESAEFSFSQLGTNNDDVLWSDTDNGGDTVSGNGGDDIIFGGDLVDILNGGTGDDIIWGRDGFDIIDGGDNNDIIRGGKGDDILRGGHGNDIIDGGDINPDLSGNDELIGGDGRDFLYGGDENDELYGIEKDGTDKRERDELYGGEGSDIYYVGDSDVIEDSDRSASIEFNGLDLTGLNFTEIGQDENGFGIAYENINHDLRLYIIGDDAIIQKNDSVLNETTSFRIKDFQDGQGDFQNGDYGLTLTEDNSSSGGGVYNLGLSPARIENGELFEYDSDQNDFVSRGSPNEIIGNSRSDNDIRYEDVNETIENFHRIDETISVLETDSFYHDNLVLRGGGGRDRIYVDVRLNDSNLLGGGFGGSDILSYIPFEDGPGTNGKGITIYGGLGADRISDGLNDDEVYGGNGDDYITTYDGNDKIYGGDGRDIIFNSDFVFRNNPELVNGDDIIFGGEDDDIINDNDGNNLLLGEQGADLILGGTSTDTIFGGTEDDLIFGDSLSSPAFPAGLAQQLRTSRAFWFEYNQELGFASKIFLSEYLFDALDTENFDGGDDIIDGGTGNDVIYAGKGSDQIDGGIGNDVILGNMGEDEIFGGDGNDDLFGNEDNDYIDGGDDNDKIYGDGGDDTLVGGDGEDEINGGDGEDHIEGGEDNDIIHGNEKDDTLIGGDGDDEIYGGSGNDTLIGGQGADTLVGGIGEDTIYGDDEDTLNGGADDDRYIISGNVQDINIVDFAGNDSLEFLGNFSASDVTLEESNGVLTINTGFSDIRINSTSSAIIEKLVFADGSEINDIITLVNNAPIVDVQLADLSINEEQLFTFTLPQNAFTDIDGNSFNLSIPNLPNWLVYNDETNTLSGTPDDQDIGDTIIEVFATDEFGLKSTETNNFNITVNGINDAPVLQNAIADQTAIKNFNFNFIIPENTFIDVEGDSITYSATLADGVTALPDWLTFNSATRTFTGLPRYTDLGELDIKVTATDAFGASGEDTFTIRVDNSTDTAATTKISRANIDSNSQGYVINDLGDINNDGYSDFFIGGISPLGDGLAKNTYSHVVHGREDGLGNAFSLASVNGGGANGFLVHGNTSIDGFGATSSLGDVNGDGFDDFGVYSYRPGNNESEGTYSGRSSGIIFGQDGDYASNLRLNHYSGGQVQNVTYSSLPLDGTNGFNLSGINHVEIDGEGGLPEQNETEQYSGILLAAAGDVNNDGYSDFIASDKGTTNEAYVFFGANNGNIATNPQSLDGTNGYLLSGANTSSFDVGVAISSLGDINNDGFDDISVSSTNETYVVFGKANGYTSSFDLNTLDGTNGFSIQNIIGVDTFGGTGTEVIHQAGDINNDNINDMLVIGNTGKAHVIYGQSSYGTSIDVNNLSSSEGATIDITTQKIAAGKDINEDGIDDLILASGNLAYTIFGKDGGIQNLLTAVDVNESVGFRIALPNVISDLDFVDDINGDNISDILIGVGSLSETYILYGGSVNSQSFLTGDKNPDPDDTITITDPDDQITNVDGGDGDDIITVDLAGNVNFDKPDINVNLGKGDTLDVNVDGSANVNVNASDTDTTGGRTLLRVSRGSGGGLSRSAARLGLGSLELTFDNSDFEIHINDFDKNDVLDGPRVIDDFEFSDGIFTFEQMIATGFDLDGTEGNDVIDGTNVVDRIQGFAGNDTLNAGDGNDVITGGVGNDVLDGGAGDDTYLFNLGDGKDIIIDTDGTDVIEFGSGILSSGFTVEQTHNDLKLKLNQNDSITIQDWFGDTPNYIEEFIFTDENITLSKISILSNLQIDIAPIVLNKQIDQFIDQDQSLNFSILDNTFFDQNNDIISYTATLDDGTALPSSWLSFDSASQTFSASPTNNEVGIWNIRLNATDSTGLSVSDEFKIIVNNINDAPILLNPISDFSIEENNPFFYSIPFNVFDDIDSNESARTLIHTLTLDDGSALPSWLGFDSEDLFLQGTPSITDVGTYELKLTGLDGDSLFVSDTFSLTVTDINESPILINGLANSEIEVGTSFSYSISPDAFLDPDSNDILSYSASLEDGSLLPSWLNFDPVTLIFSGTPSEVDAGINQIKVVATDTSGLDADSVFEIIIKDVTGTGNTTPVVDAPISDQSATEDTAFNFSVPVNTFSDADGDTLSYSATLSDSSALPIWLSFDNNTQTFSGSPENDDVGTISVRVTADDGNGGTVTDDFDITVQNTNDAPVLDNAVADQTATEDAAFSFTVPVDAFSDPDGDSLSYSATLADDSALPTWLSFDGVTRSFSGTPAGGDVGSIDVKVIASDGSLDATDTFTLDINSSGTGGNTAPTVSTPVSDQTLSIFKPFEFVVPETTFTDAEGDTLSYTASSSDGSALPSWLNFDPISSVFYGTPIITDVGNYSVNIIATDPSGLSATDTFDFDVVSTIQNTITGTNSNQTITGTSSNDFIEGLGGKDVIKGKNGDDILIGADGDDTLRGQNDNDILWGDAGKDKLHGNDGDDFLIGGTGNDVLSGDNGHDTYFFDLGWGKDIINNDDGYELINEDIIRFGEDILTSDITLSVNDNDDFLIHHSNGDRITVRYYYIGTSDVVDEIQFSQVEFADGTVWDQQDFITILATATNGDDVIYGSLGDDILNGLQGDDWIQGRGGNDIFEFDLGWGQDIIENKEENASQTTDKVQFTTGISSTDIYFTNEGDSLFMNHSSGDSVELLYSFINGQNWVDFVEFDDGISYSQSELEAMAATWQNDNITGTANHDWMNGGDGNDIISSLGGNDILHGGDGNDGGNDTLIGGTGDDTYIFNLGNDLDNIIETSGNDTVEFGGTNHDNLWFWQNGDDLRAGIIGTQDWLTVEDWFAPSSDTIETFEATDDSKVLLANQVQQLVDAMATFNPESAGNLNVSQQQQDDVQTVIAAAWS